MPLLGQGLPSHCTRRTCYLSWAQNSFGSTALPAAGTAFASAARSSTRTPRCTPRLRSTSSSSAETGTTHEVLNGIYLSGARGSVQVRLGVVPAGTANALFAALYPEHWTQDVQRSVAAAQSASELDSDVVDAMLRSVKTLAASIRSGEGCVDLPLMHVDLGDRQVVAHLVTSHALHAAILHDADTATMRARHTGIERFKAAAALNATRWTHATLTLHPLPGGVQQYSPQTSSFSRIEEGKLVLEGPFLYLNAMLTDRLESAFIPAPLSSALALPRDAVDVVVIRPTRDPELAGDPKDGETFAQTRLGPITAGMYAGGTHIDLTYDTTLPMVEYFRCAGYDFTAGAGDKDRLVCTDGFVSEAERVRRHSSGNAGVLRSGRFGSPIEAVARGMQCAARSGVKRAVCTDVSWRSKVGTAWNARRALVLLARKIVALFFARSSRCVTCTNTTISLSTFTLLLPSRFRSGTICHDEHLSACRRLCASRIDLHPAPQDAALQIVSRHLVQDAAAVHGRIRDEVYGSLPRRLALPLPHEALLHRVQRLRALLDEGSTLSRFSGPSASISKQWRFCPSCLCLLQRTGEAEAITTHYIFALGAYRALYIPNWLYRYIAHNEVDPISILSGLVQTGLYLDFFYGTYSPLSLSFRSAPMWSVTDMLLLYAPQSTLPRS
ncbi:hypothetical protein L1887_47027 [Cichorium endivia]|nr:hypothetical protein L1887_47027 [Cichorium endivia]